MATEGEVQFEDREQGNEELLEILEVRRDNSGGETVPVQLVGVDGGEANDANSALILQSQEIELNGERHVILQQAQDSETGELLVVLQGANGEPIALSSEALSSMQGLVQVSGAEGDQVITLAVSQENTGQQMVVITDSNSSTTATLPVEGLTTAASRFSLSTASKTISNLCSSATNASTNVVQAVETPRMATLQEQSSNQSVVKCDDSVNEVLNNDNAQSVNGSESAKGDVDNLKTRTDSDHSSELSDKVGTETGGEVGTVDEKGISATPSGVDFTSAVIQVQDSNNSTALEALMANAVVSAADNNYVVMTTEESGIPTEINLADVISAGSATGQTFFIETSEGLVACTSASTGEDGSIQLIADNSSNAAALLNAPQTDSQIIQNMGNHHVTYTLQSTPSGIELTPLTNVQSPVKQPLKQKAIKQTKPKAVSTTRAGETLLLPSSLTTNKTIISPVSVVNTNPKSRAVPLRNTKSSTGIHVTVTPSSYSSNIIPVQPDNSSSHLKNTARSATSTSVSSMLTTPAASQLSASRRTYSKKNNIVWLNPEQTTVTTVSRSPTSSTTSVSLSSSPTTPVKNKTVSVFSGTKSSIPPSGLTIVKTDAVCNDVNLKTSSSTSTSSPDKKRETASTTASSKDSPKQSPDKNKHQSDTKIAVNKPAPPSAVSESVSSDPKIAVVSASPVKTTETAKASKPKIVEIGNSAKTFSSKQEVQNPDGKNITKPVKIDKNKEGEKKAIDTKEIREQRKKTDESTNDDSKSMKASTTRSSKSKTTESSTSVSKVEKIESTQKHEKLQKKDSEAKSQVKSVIVESIVEQSEQTKDNEKKKKEKDVKRKVEEVDEQKNPKTTKSRNHNKHSNEAKSKTEASEKNTDKAKDLAEKHQKEAEKIEENVENKDRKSGEKKEETVKVNDKPGDSEKRSSSRKKTDDISDDQKALKINKTKPSKSKEAAGVEEMTKLSKKITKLEASTVNEFVEDAKQIQANSNIASNEKMKNDVVEVNTNKDENNDSSDKPKEVEKRTRETKKKNEEAEAEKGKPFKISKSKITKSSEKSDSCMTQPDEISAVKEKELKESKSENTVNSQEAESSEALNSAIAETPRERRTREVRKKETLSEVSKSSRTTKLKVNFKLDDSDSPVDSGGSVERLTSARKKRKSGEVVETPKKERGTRRSSMKNTTEQLVPILKKSRQYTSPRNVDRVSIVNSFCSTVDKETEEMEKRQVVASINDSRSPAERYDFAANDCQFHIRHQSTSLSPFTPRGSGGSYMCQKCGFKTTRMNNLVLHHKDQCPVVKSAVMLLWENEIRKQTKKPHENSTPVVDEREPKKRKLDLDFDVHNTESYDVDGNMEEDEDDKLEKGEAVVEPVSNEFKAGQDSASIPSDEEDDNTASDAVKKCFGFDEKEIVWADYEGIHWPALVVKVHDKDKEVTVKLIDSTLVRTCVKMSIDKVKPFDNADVNKRLLSEGKGIHGDSVVKAVQKAEDYSRKRCLGDENGAAKLFEDLNEYREPLSDEERLDDERIDENVVANSNDKQSDCAVMESDDSNDLREFIENSAQWKEKRRISNSKLLQCIKDGKIENHLLGVYRETISSDRHIKFKSGSDAEKSQLKHVPWFGPIDDEDQQEEIYDYCSQLFKSNFKPDGSFDTVAYLFEVWVPEAIVKAISRIRRIELNDAEGIFARGVILSKSEKVELEKEILKEAEKQATTNTSSN